VLIQAKIKTKAIVYSFLMPFLCRKEFKKCNVVRILQMSGAIPAIIAKLIWGIPFVATYGFNYYEKFKFQMHKVYALIMSIFINIGIKFADAIIVSSKDILGSIKQKANNDKVHFIPNGVELSLFKVIEDYNKNPDEANILFIGRLSKDKNLFMLIDALSELPEKNPILTIIGNGPLKESLQNYGYQKGVKVIFKGTIPYEALPYILAKADLFILPSLREGHPKALTDAMACGIPCVGTNVEGIREIIKNGENGLLCELNSSDLAKKIQILLEDKLFAQRLGMSARKYVEENYDLGELIRKEIKILIEVAERDA
jgi:glycosyltransferase involved in cell wall biosynthesis